MASSGDHGRACGCGAADGMADDVAFALRELHQRRRMLAMWCAGLCALHVLREKTYDDLIIGFCGFDIRHVGRRQFQIASVWD